MPTAGNDLRFLADRAPQVRAYVESFAAEAIGRTRPMCVVLYSIRRRLMTGAVALLTLWLFVHVMFGANGMVVYKQKKAEYQNLQNEIESLQKQNDGYSGEIRALQSDPKTIEKEAREQLHYARPGEVIYVAPNPVTVERPFSDAAKK